jgi:hypothetical protein
MIPRLTGRHGKLARKSDFRTLRMSSYLKGAVPTAPVSVDNIARAVAATKFPITALFPMDGNDEYGDCTICGVSHIDTLWEAFLGRVVIAPQSLVESSYFKLTGGADSGLNELDVLNWWRKNRFNGDDILAYVAVKASDHNAVKLAIELFGAVYIGIQCTQELDAQFSAGVPWTSGRLTQDGHCVVVPSYTADDLTCLTWGSDQKMTWPFWDQCVDECYCLLPPEAMLKGFNPLFDFSQLNADLRLVTN